MAAGLDSDTVQELFAAFGPVSVRRMFGGAGVWSDGLMIALVQDGLIVLKTDPDNASAVQQEGGALGSDAKKDGERQLTSYWRMPERLYDDPDELAVWARAALGVARAKQAKQAKQVSKKRPAARAKRPPRKR